MVESTFLKCHFCNRMKKFALNLIIYLMIVGGLVFGLPRLLSWGLNTPYPMAAITSGSMWPVLNEGDLVFIQGVPRESLKVGNVIVFRNDGGPGFTIHRIVELGANNLTTKGDANFDNDSPVKYENVVGRALTWGKDPVHIPYLGSITVMANNLREEKTK